MEYRDNMYFVSKGKLDYFSHSFKITNPNNIPAISNKCTTFLNIILNEKHVYGCKKNKDYPTNRQTNIYIYIYIYIFVAYSSQRNHTGQLDFCN